MHGRGDARTDDHLARPTQRVFADGLGVTPPGNLTLLVDRLEETGARHSPWLRPRSPHTKRGTRTDSCKIRTDPLQRAGPASGYLMCVADIPPANRVRRVARTRILTFLNHPKAR